MDQSKILVASCEPFILPGILPTLGNPTMKAELSSNGISSKIFYPSIRFFSKNKIQNNKFILDAIDNIPLQFSEFLFSNEKILESINYIIRTIAPSVIEESVGFTDLKKQLINLHSSAHIILQEIVEQIIELNPRIICHSFTFGDYNFASALLNSIKKSIPNIIVIAGGSNCTPEFSEKLISLIPEIDYVICDETYDTTVALIKHLLFGSSLSENIKRFISHKGEFAVATNKIKTLEPLPCPDFDDFMSEVNHNHLCIENIILPYEISRGCWWGEKKPCAMCGYFDNQKCFLIKSVEKVNYEITYLMSKYNVSYFRLTDLVEPHRKYLQDLKNIKFSNNVNLFWELRPNITTSDVALLRSLGLFYAQIGLESLSTEQLRYINKGTTAINNIFCLINLYTYKIHCVWNFLYGFEGDKKSWYEDAIAIMPLLYHLQPPDPRQVWINKCSTIYESIDKTKLSPIGNNLFYQNLTEDFNVFFKSPLPPNMTQTYIKLNQAINQWKDAFKAGYSLYEDTENSNANELVIVREYKEKQIYRLTGVDRLVYFYFYSPHSLQYAAEELELPMKLLHLIVSKFIQNKIMIMLDEKYLSLATRNSRYRWKRFNVLPNNG